MENVQHNRLVQSARLDQSKTTVTAVNLGNGQTRVSIGQRDCVMEDQLEQSKQLTTLCPTEMLAATIAG